MSDSVLILIGLASECAGVAGIGLATQSWHVYAASLLKGWLWEVDGDGAVLRTEPQSRYPCMVLELVSVQKWRGRCF